MNERDLNLISELTGSLWADSRQAHSIVRDAVCAASLTEPNPERVTEKALRALLDVAEKKGMYSRTGLSSSNETPAQVAFHSIFPEERFILIALHSGRWSYAKIARVINDTVENVQTLAWNARVHLASGRSYPAGSKSVTTSCPEYDARRPWTQKYLDEECKGQEKFFLQTHLSSCTSCRETLIRAKEVFYRTESLVFDLKSELALANSRSGLNQQLQQWIGQGLELRNPPSLTLGQSFIRFAGRWEVWFVILAWGLWWLLK